MNEKKILPIIGVISTIFIIGLIIFLRNNEYEVEFDSLGGSVIESQLVKKNEKVKEPTEPVKEDYHFIGWYLDGELFDFNSPLKKNITLTAKWSLVDDVSNETEKFTVSFDTDGGNKISSIEILANNKLLKPDEPVKSGYKFISWQLNGKDFDFDTTITKNIKLIAKWEKLSTNTNKTTTKKQTNNTTINVTGVSLSKTNINLKLGEKISITANINPDNATNKKLTWSSNNNKVATVDQNGNIQAVGEGTAIITVTVDGKTATCIVIVTEDITYSVVWEEVKYSSIGQYTLYIRSSKGQNVAGQVEITTKSGKVSIEDIPTNGKMYIKDVITKATVKKV